MDASPDTPSSDEYWAVNPKSLSRRTDKEGLQRPDRETRSRQEQDVDRLLYTFYFRRLAEVTQVSSRSALTITHQATGAYALPHNRLTHSLKVGQVARRIAQYLIADPNNRTGISVARGLDPDIAELAGKAHDIGHPPFGHIGEEILDEIARREGLEGFEGNAQTFRILATLIFRYSSGNPDNWTGLDLTARSLAACVKYPNSRGKTGKKFRKFGYITLDEDHFTSFVKPELPEDGGTTLEAAIMDWADDISYASHDIEDYVLDGTIPLSLLAHENLGEANKGPYRAASQEEFNAFWHYASTKMSSEDRVAADQAQTAFMELSTNFPKRRPDGTREGEARMGGLSSHIIRLATEATSVTKDGKLDVKVEVRALIEVLKQLTWFYVIDTPRLIATQRGQRHRLRTVTDEIIAWAQEATSEIHTEPWGETRKLSANERSIRLAELPPLLRDMVTTLLDENNRRGAYENKRAMNVAQGCIDFVASLRESEVNDYYELFR